MPPKHSALSEPIPCFVLPPHLTKPLYIPHRSRRVPAAEWTPFSGPIKSEWEALAAQKGFRIHSRIRDRLHLVLECKICGSLTAHKLYTLRTANPACGGCHEQARIARAQAAGLTFLHRDPHHCNYAYYKAQCGHTVRRGFELVERVMRGEIDIRCEECLCLRESEEARRQGWTRLGADPAGSAHYRLYQHSCGHQQRVARANMRWGQVDCAGCGSGWTARRSFLYLVRITWPEPGLDVIKLGYSGNPAKRFRHQFKLADSAEIKILRTIAVPTGHLACRLEKRLHSGLRKAFPHSVIPAEHYDGLISVVTEIYRPDLQDYIHALLDQIERDLGS